MESRIDNVYPTNNNKKNSTYNNNNKNNNNNNNNNKRIIEIKNNYSLNYNIIDPSKSSPPNEFMIKLYSRIASYNSCSKKEDNLEIE
jgi:hypothetical protein